MGQGRVLSAETAAALRLARHARAADEALMLVGDWDGAMRVVRDELTAAALLAGRMVEGRYEPGGGGGGGLVATAAGGEEEPERFGQD